MQAASGLFNTMSSSDKDLKEQAMEKMQELSDCVRRISHRVSLIKDDHSSLRDLLCDIINDLRTFTGINVTYFIPDYLPDFSKEIKLHLCRIVQELLTNAGKYAGSSTIKINLAYTGKQIVMLYKDNGPGFDPKGIKDISIGIKSIYERISLLGGKVELDSEPGKGTKWEIIIPAVNKG
jgi:signal transduction histidine kinase